MTRIEKLTRAHLESLKMDECMDAFRPYLSDESLDIIEARPNSFAIICNEEVVACLGIREYWPGRGEAWAVMPKKSGPHMTAIHRAAKAFFETCQIRRIEAAVDCDFEPGHQWARMLGFQIEAFCLKKYSVDGKDATLYARVM